MNLLSFFTLLTLTLGLSACGGGGGENAGGTPPRPIDTSGSNAGIVFDDSLKAGWGKFRAY